MLDRIVVPERLALIVRNDETLGFNPHLNQWARLEHDAAETLRWLRAGRDRHLLAQHLERRFGYTVAHAQERLAHILKWAVLRRLLYLDHHVSTPTMLVPESPLTTVYWICTQACNLRCTYCYQEAMLARPNELTTEEGKALIDQAVEIGATSFIFTGGEPFSRRDLFTLAAYSRERGLRTNVITNGHYITKKNVTEVASLFHTITISLDHGIPEHHDHQRGEGSWERAVRAIDLLQHEDVNLNINSVLSKFGVKDIKELLRFGRNRRLGAHRIIPQFPMGRGSGTRDSELSPTELLELNDQIYHAKRELSAEGGSSVRTEGSYGSKGVLRNHCGAGLSEISVDPEGWVYPCKLLQYDELRTDNVRTRRLIEIYKEHPLLKEIQSRTTDRLHPCKTCVIKNHCGGGCRGFHYSFSQSYTTADALFCTYLRRTFEVQAWESTGSLPGPRQTDFHQAPARNFIPLTALDEVR